MIIADIEPMILGLKSEDAHLRCQAAEALGQVGNPFAIEPLCEALKDPDPSVRKVVIAALVSFGDPAVFCEALKVADETVRAAAAEALCQIESTDAVGVLYDYVSEEFPGVGLGCVTAGVFALARMAEQCRGQEVRGAAMAALRKTGSTAVFLELHVMLKSGPPAARKLAAETLGLMGSSGSAGALCRSLNDPEPLVRREAAKALGGYSFAAAVPALCAALQDEDWWVRWRAAESLGVIGDSGAVEPLCTALEDSKVAVRRSAADALGSIGDAAAVFGLCRARQTSVTAKVAALALERIGADSSLALQVLVHSGLTGARKLDTLQAMKESGFSIGAIDRYCLSIQERADTTSREKAGASEVLTEFKKRRNEIELLRAGDRDLTDKSSELLRGASGSASASPKDELLKAAEAPTHEQRTRSRSLLDRLFGRR